MRSRHVYGEWGGVKHKGGVVDVIPKAKRKCNSILSDMRNKREENGCGAAWGRVPQAIWGHYRLLSDIQYIYTLRYCTTEGFLQHLGLQFRPVPGLLILLRDSSGMTLIYGNILNAGSAPLFLVRPVWIIFTFDTRRESKKRYFEQLRVFF